MKFLINVNLPYYLSLWRSEDFIFQRDIDAMMPDTRIWQFAKENDLIIVTKDSDFANRIVLSNPPPKVVHVRLGNISLRNFKLMMDAYWPQIVDLTQDHKLVTVFPTHIVGLH